MAVFEISLETMRKNYHYPVMHKEVIKLLELNTKKIVVDCTAGVGSHLQKLLYQMPADSFLIGIDRDADSLAVAEMRLGDYEGRFKLINDNFIHIDNIIKEFSLEGVDAFLFDLGISIHQLNNPERGFSFLKEGPLDMRMDRNSFLSAYDLVNNLSEKELGNIFRKFGEERYYRRVAYTIAKERKKEPIATTTGLTKIILRSIPAKSQYSRIHPATRIFQALRIVVNRELEALETALGKAIMLLNKGGRIGVISFHSLEDRIVKHTFRKHASEGILKVITKKPLIPSLEEKTENSPSRSAKFRVAEKK